MCGWAKVSVNHSGYYGGKSNPSGIFSKEREQRGILDTFYI